jgi:hypothetical protein
LGLGSGGGGTFEILSYLSGRTSHLAWKQVHWLDQESSFDEVRPTAGNLDFDARDEIIVGLGPGGGGWIQAFDDSLNHFDFLGSRRIAFSRYNVANGESWPALTCTASSTCFGDFDRDGDVDDSDLQIMESFLAETTWESLREGDFDGDGDIDDSDLKVFQSNLGRSCCAPPARGPI